MENIPNEEVEEEMAAIPLNSTYSGHGGHGHMIHHHQNNHILIPSSNSNNPPITHTINVPISENTTNKKMGVVKYKECMKNHAASMGGAATDGCGEFMPSGGDGSLEALICSACNCHRNFHRKETDQSDNPLPHHQRLLMARSFHNKGGFHSHPLVSHQHMIMSYNNHMGGGGGGGGGDDQSNHHRRDHEMMMVMKKRFRTKFSQEQKEKMFEFAERVGWKIQKLDESVVQRFCQEVGVKRRVLKVWMHNNKYNLAKKNNNNSNHVNLSINHDHDDDQNQVDLEHC